MSDLPAYKKPGSEEVTITISKDQARAILSALNKQFAEERHEHIRQAYQSIELQVYGPIFARDGRPEAAKRYDEKAVR